MTCETMRPAPLRCPTLPERIAATLGLLPIGRAWGGEDGSPEPYRDAAFDAEAFDGEAFDTESKPGTFIYRFFAAIAQVLHFAETSLCALVPEFFCATASTTRDLWMQEYGLPDACDPFPDLCAKVAAIGGARCEYYAAVAERAGWRISCDDMVFRCRGAIAGRSIVGRAKAASGIRALNKLQITVHLADSAAFTGKLHARPMAGRLRAGRRLMCAPDISPLVCVIERVVHAHIDIDYRTA